MLDFATKVDNSGDTLSAVEFNNYISELENAVTGAGLTLDGTGVDVTQLFQAITLIAAGGGAGAASQATVDTGTDFTQFVTALTLTEWDKFGQVLVASDDTIPRFLEDKITSSSGSIDVATATGVASEKFVDIDIIPVPQVDAEAGIINDKAMTPLRTDNFDQKRKFVGTALPATGSDPIGTVYYIYV